MTKVSDCQCELGVHGQSSMAHYGSSYILLFSKLCPFVVFHPKCYELTITSSCNFIGIILGQDDMSSTITVAFDLFHSFVPLIFFYFYLYNLVCFIPQ